MKLKFENIGKIKTAEVEIKKITLIAGLNSTGKSTVGKLLYCIFNSFHDFDKEFEKVIKSSIRSRLLRNPFVKFQGIEKCVDELYKMRFSTDEKVIKSKIEEYAGTQYLSSKDNVVQSIIDVLNLSDDDIRNAMLQNKLNSEFNGQIQNIFSKNIDSSISLLIKNNEIKVNIKNNKVTSINNFINLEKEAIYIDDPFVLDNLDRDFIPFNTTIGHKRDLQDKLTYGSKQGSEMEDVVRQLLTQEKIKTIFDQIDSVCKGNIVENSKSGFVFQYENSKINLSISNLSTGLKTFSIIKTLLLNGSLEDNGTIILDEPEIHLHPEWQKKLAEIIVLLQIKFGMHILINSHSPYFINAIEVYAKKYGISDSCKFYMSEDNNDRTASIKDVSGNLESIYKLLYEPMQELEDERFDLEND